MALVIIASKKNPGIRTIGVNNGNETLRQVAIQYDTEYILEPPLNAEEVYRVVRLILEGTAPLEDEAENQLTSSQIWP